MKRWLAALLTVLLLLGTALAENVVQKPCIVTTEMQQQSGVYTGEWQNGLPHGYGVFVCDTEETPWHYVGQWENGLMHGHGGMYWDDGRVEVGEFSFGVLAAGTIIGRDGRAHTVGGTQKPQGYIGNKKTKKLHYPDCDSVSDMNEANRVTLESREEAIRQGYVPCKKCNP